MADNVNPEAKRIANEKVRPAADALLRIFYTMKSLQSEYTGQSWAALFPAGDPTGEVIDGARQDGRHVVTNGDITDVFTALSGFITFMEATSSQQLNRFLKVSVNPEPR